MGSKLTLSRPAPKPDRLESIDLLRGVVMVLMALDHVRDFMSDRLYLDATDLQTSSPANFLTRWITHFCAPTFMFLAGTGAFLSGTRGKSRSELSWFLFTRGLWLAFLEVTINRMLWWFNYDLYHHGAGVFWAIGWSMVVLSVLVYLPTIVVALFGVAVIVLHNLLDGLTASQVHLPEVLWMILHSPGDTTVVDWTSGSYFAGTLAYRQITFGTGYCLIPWIGTMAAGYGLGAVMTLPRPARRRWLFLIGTIATLGFVVLRGINIYGDPRPRLDPRVTERATLAARAWSAAAQAHSGQYLAVGPMPYLVGGADQALPLNHPYLWDEAPSPLWSGLSFLNCTKYPASLLYLLMTLGPAILALAIFDRPLGPVAQPIITFGRVPLFYYLLHIPLIHITAAVVDCVRFGWSPLITGGPWDVRPLEVPGGYGLSLPMVYLVWALVVLALYPPCRWFADVKRRYRSPWLSYL
jgi:uncharacterized membrane protein